MLLMRLPYAGFGLVALLGALAGGCGSRAVPAAGGPPPAEPAASAPAAPEPRPPDDPAAGPDGDAETCAVLPGPGEPISRVALTDRVDPSHAPHGTNDSERLLFAHLYETLVRIDCEGRIRPGLASAWELDADGRSWILTLRPGARFSDGTPLTTADVVGSLSGGPAGTAAPESVVQLVYAITDRLLAVVLRGDATDTPRALADTRLAVVRRPSGAAWPTGTTGLVASSPASQADGRSIITLTTAPAFLGAAGTGVAPPVPLEFVVDPETDPRDFLDEGIDLVVTRDPATLEYAATLPHYLPAPLAWTHTRVFLSRWRNGSTPPLTQDARQALADDAVRGDARGAEGPFWWEAVAACQAPTTAPPAPADDAPGGRVVYERGDSAARDLAERIVGLAAIPNASADAVLEPLARGAPARLYQRAIGLQDDALRAALRRGLDSGYILSFPRHPPAPCEEWQSAVDRIPWLHPGAIVPLIDTRPWAIVRQGRSGVIAEPGGGLLVRSDWRSAVVP